MIIVITVSDSLLSHILYDRQAETLRLIPWLSGRAHALHGVLSQILGISRNVRQSLSGQLLPVIGDKPGQDGIRHIRHVHIQRLEQSGKHSIPSHHKCEAKEYFWFVSSHHRKAWGGSQVMPFLLL